MLIEIENEMLKAKISSDGAELREVKNKNNNIDYMWTGDDKYWGRVSPILFPIVGALKNEQYQVDDKTFSMSQHGFLRDAKFESVYQDESRVSFVFESDGAFTNVYPYEFRILIHYTLQENSLNVEWEVINLDKKTMYFSIGAHPAFRVPLLENERMEDFHLLFTKAENEDVIEFNVENSLVRENGTANDISMIPLSSSLFENDAIIYSNIDSIKLASSKSDHSVEVLFEEFPYVGVWSKYDETDDTIAPFVCIEPWHGLADMQDSDGDFKNKRGINELEVGETFKTDYSMKFE